MPYIFYNVQSLDAGAACALLSFVYESCHIIPGHLSGDFDPTGHDIFFIGMIPPDLERYACASKLKVFDDHQENLKNGKQKLISFMPHVKIQIKTNMSVAKQIYEFCNFDEKNKIMKKMIHYIDLYERNMFDSFNEPYVRSLHDLIESSSEKDYVNKFLEVYNKLSAGLIVFD